VLSGEAEIDEKSPAKGEKEIITLSFHLPK
jgi:hypothetical protein